jgi:hypothetical protein
MLCMLFMLSGVLIPVEYLHSMSYKHLLTLYVVSSMKWPREFLLYPMALRISCLWWWLQKYQPVSCPNTNNLCFGRRLVFIIIRCHVVALSFCIPSWVSSRVCRVWSSCGLVTSICVCDLQSLVGLLPRSMLMIGHLHLLWLSSRSWKSLNVLLCLDFRSLELCLHPPRRCVFVSGWLHLPHTIGPCVLCLYLHRYTYNTHATS